MTGIYLDNSTTTRPSEKAVSGMMPFFTDLWGSPLAPHTMGQQLYPSIKESYQAIYDLLGATKEDTVLFTSSGDAAAQHAITSTYFNVSIPTGKDHFVASPKQMTAETIGDVITPRTAMVSLPWADGLTGVINPVEEIAALCQERGIIFHLDATHVLGKLYFDLKEVGADFISFSGSHIHAPQGTGALYIKSGVKCSALSIDNVPGLVGLGIAAKEAVASRDFLCMEIARLRKKLETGILEKYPDAVVLFQNGERLPNVSAINFPGIVNEALLFFLNQKGVYASIEKNHSAVSFSLSRETTEDEIDRAVEIIVESAKRLSKCSAKK